MVSYLCEWLKNEWKHGRQGRRKTREKHTEIFLFVYNCIDNLLLRFAKSGGKITLADRHRFARAHFRHSLLIFLLSLLLFTFLSIHLFYSNVWLHHTHRLRELNNQMHKTIKKKFASLFEKNEEENKVGIISEFQWCKRTAYLMYERKWTRKNHKHSHEWALECRNRL